MPSHDRILHAFYMYGGDAEWEVSRWVRNYSKLSPQHKSLIPNHNAKVESARQCVQRNQTFLASIARSFDEPALMEGALKAVQTRLKSKVPAAPADIDKAR